MPTRGRVAPRLGPAPQLSLYLFPCNLPSLSKYSVRFKYMFHFDVNFYADTFSVNAVSNKMRRNFYGFI